MPTDEVYFDRQKSKKQRDIERLMAENAKARSSENWQKYSSGSVADRMPSTKYLMGQSKGNKQDKKEVDRPAASAAKQPTTISGWHSNEPFPTESRTPKAEATPRYRQQPGEREWQSGNKGGTYNSRDYKPTKPNQTANRPAPVNKNSRQALEAAFAEEQAKEKKRKKAQMVARLQKNLNDPSKRPTSKATATGKKGAGPVRP